MLCLVDVSLVCFGFLFEWRLMFESLCVLLGL